MEHQQEETEATGYKVLVIILLKKMQQQWTQGPWDKVVWGHDIDYFNSIVLTVLTLSGGIGM